MSFGCAVIKGLKEAVERVKNPDFDGKYNMTCIGSTQTLDFSRSFSFPNGATVLQKIPDNQPTPLNRISLEEVLGRLTNIGALQMPASSARYQLPEKIKGSRIVSISASMSDLLIGFAGARQSRGGTLFLRAGQYGSSRFSLDNIEGGRVAEEYIYQAARDDLTREMVLKLLDQNVDLPRAFNIPVQTFVYSRGVRERAVEPEIFPSDGQGFKDLMEYIYLKFILEDARAINSLRGKPGPPVRRQGLRVLDLNGSEISYQVADLDINGRIVRGSMLYEVSRDHSFGEFVNRVERRYEELGGRVEYMQERVPKIKEAVKLIREAA